MAIKDNKSKTDVVILYNDIITSNGTITTGSVDSAEYDRGITFTPIFVFGGGGESSVSVTQVQDSADNLNFSIVENNQLIGNLFDLIFTEQVLNGDILKTLGVIGNKRFVRLILSIQGFLNNINFMVTINGGVEVFAGND